jgi:signal transduction histidine kinase
MQADPEPVDLRAISDDAVARLGEMKVLEGVSVVVDGAATVGGHGQKLRQVVLNLVKNAAEASGPGGRVEVRVVQGSDGARLSVSDNGPGLSQTQRERLFEPFFTTKGNGTGLGLAVSKGIVAAHGGSIEVGPAPSGGARFEVWLPATPPGKV